MATAVDPYKMPMHAWENREVRLLFNQETNGGEKFRKGMIMLVEHTYRGKLNLQARDGRRITRINRRRVELVTPLTEMPRRQAEWRRFYSWGDAIYEPVGMTARSVMLKLGHKSPWTTTKDVIVKACEDAGVDCKFR